jgi:hypothetical protein
VGATTRIAEAEAARWTGEAEGLKVSLAGARDKLTQMNQITARRSAAVSLGMPGSPSGGRCRAASSRLRTSGCCGRTPATGGTW